MIIKILFSLITIIIPLKLYKVHSILKSGRGGERGGSQFGQEASSVDSNKDSPAGLGEAGGGGPVVQNKNVDRLKKKKKKKRPPTRKQDERARSGGRGAQSAACCCWAQAGTQAGSSDLVGGRFLCLKYCTTCWGSSASTALAKVSFAALRNSRKGTNCTISRAASSPV